MDYQALELGLAAWFARASGIAVDDVVWQGAPLGVMAYPRAFLSIVKPASGVGTDEVRLEAQGAGLDAQVRLTGNRLLTLSARVQSRSALPSERAAVHCERVRDAMQRPSTQAALEQLGVAFMEVAALVNLGRTHDLREENEAVIDIKLSAALDSTPAGETVGTIEQVSIGGSAGDGADGTVDVPSRVIS